MPGGYRIGLIAAVAALALGAPLRAQAIEPFSDVNASYWAYDAIRLLVADKLIDGLPGGAFGGERPLTRPEFARLLERLQARFDAQLGATASRGEVAGLDERTATLGAATDELGTRIARLEAAAVRASALLEGYPGGALGGERPITRAEMATLAARLVARMDTLAAQTASKHDLDAARALLGVTDERLAALDGRVARLEGGTARPLAYVAASAPVNRNAAAMAGTIAQLRLDAAAAQLAAKDALDRLQKRAIAISAELDVLGVRVTRLEESRSSAVRT